MSSEPNAQVERTDPLEPAPPALTLVEPAPPEEPAEQAAPRWGLARRILFRFAFAYLVLYNLPFPLHYIPYVDLLVQDYPKIWSFVVPWVGDDVFNVDINVQPNGSGDTTYNYVQVFCYLMLALAATAIWSFLDRRRANYVRLHDWLRVYVRLALALWMLTYGAAKVIPTQFATPTPDRLVQMYGDSSPMGLLWTFMGASMAYTIFSGLAEMAGGLLLIARRTQLLGALVCMGVMLNVVLLNFCYDVPVKLFSSHLFLMAIFLILPDVGRLTNLLVLNRRVDPPVVRPLFRRKWLHRSALVLRTVFVLGWAGMFLYQSWQGSKEYGSGAPKPPLYGVWNVEQFEVDGAVRPPLVTDETRWRRMAFSYPGMTSIQLMSDTRERYRLALDPAGKRMRLTRRDDPEFKASLTYTQPGPKLLVIQGTHGDQRIRARLRQMDTSEFLLVSRGFHWINEYPFNR